MNVLLVGSIEPSLAQAVRAKYKALQLPNDATRPAFLAEHGTSITAIVDGGPPTVRSRSMMRELVLRNLDQYLNYGTLTTPVVPADQRSGLGA